MKFLIFSDIHIHSYYGQGRLENCLKAFQKLLSIASDNNLSVLFAGDLFDQGNPSTKVFLNVFNIIKNFPDVRIFAINGNHDYATRNTLKISGLSLLSLLDEVLDNFILVDSIGYHDNKFSIYGISYFSNKKDFNTFLESIYPDFNKFNILLTHQTPKGISNVHIEQDTDPKNPLYDNFDLIINGHIHNREELTETYFNIGSPIHRDLDDAGKEKGYYIFENSKMRFYHLKGFFEIEPIVKIENNVSNVSKNFELQQGKDKLLYNYWKQEGEEDEELLKIGKKLIK